MQDNVEFRHTLRRLDVPLLRGRLNEHEAGGGAGLPHYIEEASDRMRPVGVLIAVARVADRLFDLYFPPVCVQLVRDHERERSTNTGSHLRAMSDYPYRRWYRSRQTHWDGTWRDPHAYPWASLGPTQPSGNSARRAQALQRKPSP